MMSFSGLSGATAALEGIEQLQPRTPLFLELMACPGGCVNGPKTARTGGLAARRCHVLDYAPREEGPREPSLDIPCDYPPEPVPPPGCTPAQIREVLRATGKQAPEDELNCGGCGYDSCRAFATAFLAGRAERRMCVTYMRKLAEKKMHALMRKMPSAAVIVDENLRIVEHNPNFAKFFGGGDLEGALLDTVVPFYNLFENALRDGEEVYGRDIRFRGAVYSVTVFVIEKNALIGGIFRDVTQPAVHKEQIIERTRQVIQKNLQTVQQIAYLMGENAAETEIALNSIVESFTPESVDEDDEGR
jgi:PAS domain-containing protein